MRLLVLGGTKFYGRAVVEAALARGHELTLFNRGETNPDLFPGTERLRGDRDGDLSALAGRSWDAVVDPCGYVPRVVRASAELLAPAVGHYTFISSISVYADFSRRMDETAPVAELDDPNSEDVQEHYGALKAACERVVEQTFPGRALTIRPGLIVGPHDPTGRFTYWPVRVARGGDVLAPAPPDRRVQFVDARDLADWTVRMVEQRATGTYNATGPVPRPTMAELLEACRRASGSDGSFVWVDSEFLLERGVGVWMELPLWMPHPEWAGLLDADVGRAVSAGLTFRPLEATARDTLAWAEANGGATAPLASGVDIGRAGLAPEREAALLEEWRGRA